VYPVLFRLGWVAIPSFTALMALALGIGLALTWQQARRTALTPMDVLDAALGAVLGGVIAARAVYTVENWGYFGNHANEIVQVWRGGLSWHGGLAGGAIGAAVISAQRKLDLRAVLDAFTPGLMAGAVLGWIGCFWAGAAYGREVFPGSAWWFLAADLPDIYGLWNPRFPAQWFGAAWAAVCFALSMFAWRGEYKSGPHRARRLFIIAGGRFAATAVLYSAGMFALGFMRGDAVPMVGGWRADQIIDAAIAAAGVVYLFVAFVSQAASQRR